MLSLNTMAEAREITALEIATQEVAIEIKHLRAKISGVIELINLQEQAYEASFERIESKLGILTKKRRVTKEASHGGRVALSENLSFKHSFQVQIQNSTNSLQNDDIIDEQLNPTVVHMKLKNSGRQLDNVSNILDSNTKMEQEIFSLSGLKDDRYARTKYKWLYGCRSYTTSHCSNSSGQEGWHLQCFGV